MHQNSQANLINGRCPPEDKKEKYPVENHTHTTGVRISSQQPKQETEHTAFFNFNAPSQTVEQTLDPCAWAFPKQTWQLLVPLTQNKNMKLFPVVSCFTVGAYSHAFDMAILTVHSWAQFIIHPEVEIYSSPLHYKMLCMCTPFNTASFTPMMPFFIKRTTCLLYVCLGLSSVSAEMGLPITIMVEEFKKRCHMWSWGLSYWLFALHRHFTEIRKGVFNSELITVFTCHFDSRDFYTFQLFTAIKIWHLFQNHQCFAEAKKGWFCWDAWWATKDKKKRKS